MPHSLSPLALAAGALAALTMPAAQTQTQTDRAPLPKVRGSVDAASQPAESTGLYTARELSDHLGVCLNADNPFDKRYCEKVSSPGRQNFHGAPSARRSR